MKRLSATILHYGSEYLEYALEAVNDSVDEMLILYSTNPTMGHQNRTLRNPDNRDRLKAIADKFDKVTWIDITRSISQETVHRQMYVSYARDHQYDQILIVDSDEVWHPDYVTPALDQAANHDAFRVNIAGKNWFHFWKSFNEYVQDGFYPLRIINVKGQQNREHPPDRDWET